MKEAKIANEIVKARGRIGVGSHDQLRGLGYHSELWMVQSGGRPNLLVLGWCVASRYGSLAATQQLVECEPSRAL